MKILVLNYEYPPIGGGGGVISQYISEGLASLNHDITIVTVWLEGLQEYEEKGNLKIFRMKSLRKNTFRSNPREMISWIRISKQFLKNICFREQFDLCFAHFVIPGGEVALYLKRKFRIPYLVMSHGHDLPWVRPYSLYFLHTLAWFRLKKICSSSAFNLVQTIEMKQNIDRFTGASLSYKNVLITNGCDPAFFNGEKEKGSKQLMHIMFSGRLTEQKDPMTMLKAIRNFAKLSSGFILNIYGDGPLREKAENFVKKNQLVSHIIFHGKVLQEEMLAAYKTADLLISSSVSEGMSITILEALCSGVYAIVTPASGNSELIQQGINGELFGFSDEKELEEKISRFYYDKFLKEYKVPSETIEMFRGKYNWNGIVKSYDDLIKTVVLP